MFDKIIISLSDEAIGDEAHEHYAWTSPYTATNTKYDNYFWADVESPILLVDGYYYYITQSDGIVWKRNTETGSSSSLFTISSTWPVWGQTYYHYTGNYSQIAYAEQRLYINTYAEIISIDCSGGNRKTHATQDTSEGYIWGLRISGRELEYFVSRDRYYYGVEAYKTVPILQKSFKSSV